MACEFIEGSFTQAASVDGEAFSSLLVLKGQVGEKLLRGPRRAAEGEGRRGQMRSSAEERGRSLQSPDGAPPANPPERQGYQGPDEAAHQGARLRRTDENYPVPSTILSLSLGGTKALVLCRNENRTSPKQELLRVLPHT